MTRHVYTESQERRPELRGAGAGVDRTQLIKQMIADDEYDTPERVDAAIDALARDLQETRQTDKTP